MQNCADQYAERLADDRCRLFSIRREREHVATLEVGPHSREAGMLAITQLKGRHNMAAPLDVWQAAYAWLAAQSGLRRLPPRIPPERQLDDDVWRQLMGPFAGVRAARHGWRKPRRSRCSTPSTARWPTSPAAAASPPGSSRSYAVVRRSAGDDGADVGVLQALPVRLARIAGDARGDERVGHRRRGMGAQVRSGGEYRQRLDECAPARIEQLRLLQHGFQTRVRAPQVLIIAGSD